VAVFDGEHIWVLNAGTNNVTKLNTQGVTVGTFSVGQVPTNMAFDGTHMWVTNFQVSSVTRL
jgi:DNA-binding beta-propeller fold protein YncE